MKEINSNMFVPGIKLLCRYGSEYQLECEKFLRLKVFNEQDLECLKNFLCKTVMLNPELIAHCFPKELLWILTSTMSKSKYQKLRHLNDSEAKRNHQCNCVVLGKLLTVHPDVLKFSLQYFNSNFSPFDDNHFDVAESPHKKFRGQMEQNVSEHELVLCCWSFLIAAPEHFKGRWNWSEFMQKYGCIDNPTTRWIVFQCIGIITEMTESQVHKMCTDANLDVDKISVEFYSSLTSAGHKFTEEEITNEEISINDYKSSMNCTALNNVVRIMDITLPSRGKPKEAPYPGGLVSVPSTDNNLRSVALAVAAGRAVCLSGPVGSGKTSLVEHLARATGERLIKVQLGDQTDSKMLLGSYRCTDVPGEFLWEPGVLTQTVMNGQWLLLEDVDSAALDVSSVLSGLIETGFLSVPGYRDQVQIAPGFQMFLTQRLMSNTSGNRRATAGCLLDKALLQVRVEPMSCTELVTVVEQMFPVLRTIAERMVNVFMMFSSGNHDRDGTAEDKQMAFAGSCGRLISTRDLIKWCCRCVVGYDVSSKDTALKVLQDALDVFCASIVNEASRCAFAESIAAHLGIVATHAEYYCKSHKPRVELSSTALTVGRASIIRKQREMVTLVQTSENYAFTKSASCLLERVATCIELNEPVLLVGETGTGKTSSVQYLASKTGRKLIVINMNQQSDSADLLGGYKPVDFKFIMTRIRDEFEDLFRGFYNQQKNEKFLGYIGLIFNKGDWKSLVVMMKKCQRSAMAILLKDTQKGGARKAKYLRRWQNIGNTIDKLEIQLRSKASLAFSFIEGSLVRAIQDGNWVLLDEINLASAETLECLSELLEGSAGSLSLIERGDREPIKRHEDFTLFACMNPATDVGKKNLPAGLRNRFTELYVDELTERNDLILLVEDYLKTLSPPLTLIKNIVKFYISVRKEAASTLCDGTGHKPHYSLRTLCRSLSIAQRCPCGSLARSLYEALCLGFLTQLDGSSHRRVEVMISEAVLGKQARSLLGQPIPEPTTPCVQFEGYWVPRGKLDPETPQGYVLTESVRRNLKDISRVVSIGKLPILLQGDTSVGKTSLITYLARASGNYCVRINNHEHTDLQEYIGSYVADERGSLVFQEGILVQAMRKGHWVILDELNLAPSDVLEALNRVLDDNRELFIPETQATVKAHPGFMLFATQNPPGLYGGRKLLSRAFKNRFVELHFGEIPPNELQIILSQRCHVPPSYSKKMIAVMTELQLKRRGSAACAGKQGYMTLRDLFRWGERYHLASNENNEKYYDWDQHIADEGYLVLGGRVRQTEERDVIREVINKQIKRNVNPENLFTLNDKTSPVTRDILHSLEQMSSGPFSHIVWTRNMRRLAVLIGKSFQFQEPVLLVGETGCGKTTVCQVLASRSGQELKSVNCHLHTEASDFLGGLRPTREKHDGGLFEWVDGPLVEAMRNGDLFLADEISLADDSVLERLNSLLEPERRLLLAEKNTKESENSSEVIAANSFHFTATMNPAGDYGKKELSPALRNRFTEIWCDSQNSREDLLAIIEHNLITGLSFGNQQDGSSGIGHCILDFMDWFRSTLVGNRFPKSIRDILTWVHFINFCSERGLTLSQCYIHGANLTFLDGLGSGLTACESLTTLTEIRNSAMEFLCKQLDMFGYANNTILEKSNNCAVYKDNQFGIDPFYIPLGEHNKYDENDTENCQKFNVNNKMDIEENDVAKAKNMEIDFAFAAPTTGMNTLRLLRGMQLGKAILLEGSPGVGKTSLVTALAKSAGHRVLRINLSDQTDISDLFGADLPVEGESAGRFAWRDGPFLQALKQGHWILLDELNLAPQSVLEGLNACLDHRGEVFVPELGRVFHVKQGTRLFACQNPLKQGGARRGLPQSFLNRFTQVYMDSLSSADLEFIAASQYPEIDIAIIKKMVEFNTRLARETGELHLWGYRGAPWEMNLRDIQRWCSALVKLQNNGNEFIINPSQIMDVIYMDRMRTHSDKQRVKQIYYEIFGKDNSVSNKNVFFYMTADYVYVGDSYIQRNNSGHNNNISSHKLLVLRKQLPVLRSMIYCINLNWLCILIGAAGTGKTSCVRLLAQICNRKLKVLSVNSAMDTTEILGGFEQADYNRHLQELSVEAEQVVLQAMQHMLCVESSLKSAYTLLHQWEKYKELSTLVTNSSARTTTMSDETKLFQKRISDLKHILIQLQNKSHVGSIQGTVDDLIDKCNILNTCVKKDNTLNAGGKFEWVDSVLVKCLRDGCWLLIDNVNLCSSAVLDRLNGLLEPNGELSISERGVGSDGELITIKPHPDFRLFLAMDPHHGEISRAMRNRGVEICILDNSEVFDGSSTMETLKPVNVLDQHALLGNEGVLQNDVREILIAVHEAVSAYLPAFNRPTTSQLLHTGFLTSQQITRGVEVRNALVSSCINVYVKAKEHHRDVKEKLIDIINDCIGQKSGSTCCKSVFNVDNMTLCADQLCYNIKLAVVKQHSELPLGLIQTSDDSDVKKALQSIITDDVDFADINSERLLVQLLLVSYQMSSKADVNIRFSYLDNCINTHRNVKINVADKFRNINNILYHTICESTLLKSAMDTVPWDHRFFPDLKTDKQIRLNTDNIEKIFMSMYFNVEKYMQELRLESVEPKTPLKKSKTLTILEYSNAVLNNHLSDSINQPILKYFISIFQCFDAFLFELLRDENIVLHPLVNFKPLFWLFRFYELGNIIIINRQNKIRSIDETLAELTVHFKWLLKSCKMMMVKLDDNLKVIENDVLFDRLRRLTELLVKIETSVSTVNSPLITLGRRFKRIHGQSFPYCSSEECELNIKFDAILQKFNVWTHCDQQHIDNTNSRIKMLCTKKGQKMRSELIIAYNELKNGNLKSHNLRDVLDELGNFCSENLASNDNSVLDCNEKFSTQLWPVKEYYLFILLNKLRYLMSRNLQMPNESIAHLNEIIEILQQQTQIPPSLTNSVMALSTINPENDKYKSVFNEVVQFLMQFAVKSSSVLPTKWSMTNNIEDILNEVPLGKHTPLLTGIVVDILNAGNLNLESLGAIYARKRQLTCLNKLLWNNMLICQVDSDYVLTDAKCAITAYELFINDLKAALKLSLNVEDIVKSTSECKEAINLLYEDTNNKLMLTYKDNILGALQKCADKVVDLQKLIVHSNAGHLNVIFTTAQIHTLLGFLKMTLNSNLGQIDPVQKHSLKLKYTKDEMSLYKNYICAAKLHQYVQSGFYNTSHEQVLTFQSMLNVLIETEDKLSKNIAYRPQSKYHELLKEYVHFMNSLSTPEVVLGLYDRLDVIKTTLTMILDMQDGGNNHVSHNVRNNEVIKGATQVLGEVASWINSQQRFYDKIVNNFKSSYPDLTKPFLESLTELNHGFYSLKLIIMKLCTQVESLGSDINGIVQNLVSFPSVGVQQSSLIVLAENTTAENLVKLLSVHCENEEILKTEGYHLMLNGLSELKNQCVVSNEIESAWPCMKTLLENLTVEWVNQERNTAQKKIDDDNLYVTKTKCENVTDDEMDINEIKELFPSYDDADFSDFKQSSLNANKTKEKSTNSKNALISSDDIVFISNLHLNLMTLTKSEWITRNKIDIRPNYVTPLVQRYKTLQLLVKRIIRGLDYKLDINLVASLNLLTAVTLNKVEGVNIENETTLSPTRTHFDFYSTSKVDEAKKGLNVLQNVLIVVNEQLQQWPEHPVLNDIVTIIQRILSFSVTSPLVRFLTGVELLRDKVEEWNKNAHRGNNMQSQSLDLGQLIVEWRKLELNSWRDSLSNVFDRSKAQASKYWFHIYALLEQFLTQREDNTINIEQFSVALKQFLEKSSLAEYSTRLNIIYAFHCHVIHLEQFPDKVKLLSVLWNVHSYYSQFIENVNTKIREQRTPIEKKLRDFVKISSWERDLSYWGVKDRVDKAHKALHKHIKEFTEVLKQPVIGCLVDIKCPSESPSDTIGIWDRPHRQSNQYQYMTEPLNYVSNIKLKRLLNENDVTEVAMINKMSSLFNKARHLCKEAIHLNSYPRRLQILDIFLTEIINTSAHLRSLEISQNLPKPKQKSQAKSILQQKRKALSDLFKQLSQLGLSHRLGLLQINIKGDKGITDLSLPPLDIKAAFTYLKSRKCDGALLTVWEGCEMYLMRSIARFAALETSLKTPAKDLGMQNIERCRGFSADLLTLAQSQKFNLAKTSRLVCALRTQIHQLVSFEDCEVHPKQSALQTSLNKLKNILVSVITTLGQFELLLKSCPPANEVGSDVDCTEIAFDSVLSSLPMLKARNGDLQLTDLLQSVKSIINVCTKLQSSVDKSNLSVPQVLRYNLKDSAVNHVNFISPVQYQVIKDGFSQMSDVANKIQTIRCKFETENLKHPLCKSLNYLEDLIRYELHLFSTNIELRNMEVSADDSTNVETKFIKQIDDVVIKILLSIQNLSKKYMNTNIESQQPSTESTTVINNKTSNIITDVDGNGSDSEQYGDIEEKHLKQMINEQINEDFTLLDLSSICGRLEGLISTYCAQQEANYSSIDVLQTALLRCVPLLDQLALISQFFLTQQVAAHRLTCKMLSVLLNIFLELGAKGFCVPPELSEEEESEGTGNRSEGLGLGDGDGQRDVSDRIENEDQLDDAQPQGQERKKEDDKDCKEEENAIEMSEDFDSKHQDVDPKEDQDDESEEEDNEDADKQMGETNTEADQLDKQIWGSDDEEGEGEDNQNEDESGMK